MNKQKQLTPFQQALRNVSLEQFANVPKESELPDQFSPAFLRNMQRLAAKTQRAGWHYVNTGLKRAAIAAVLVALLATSALANPAVREGFIPFFLNNHGIFYSISFDPQEAADAPEEIQTVMLPTYLPAGFSASMTNIFQLGVFYVYTNDLSQEIIYYIQETVSNRSDISIDAEGNTTSTMLVGDYLVTIISDEDFYLWLWTDNDYLYSLTLDNSIPVEEAKKIFHSIQPQTGLSPKP